MTSSQSLAKARPQTILIAGGGIGGLTAAACLQQRGFKVTVLEQAESLSDIGAGIQLSPNAMGVFSKLGLQPALLKAGFQPRRLEMRHGDSGKIIFSLPTFSGNKPRWHYPYVHMHRADLIDILADLVHRNDPAAIRSGSTVTAVEQANEQATVSLATGELLKADLVIGADAIHSSVRESVFNADQPRFTGYIAWRMTVETELLGEHVPPPTACVWTGDGRHAVTYRLRGGQLANLVGVVEHDHWSSESWTELGTRKAALEDFQHFSPTVTTIIDKASSHFRWALFERPPMQHWHQERVVLLGDACHATLPFLAQGAAMAIEDAWVLATLVSGNQPLEAALSQYHKLRFARTTRIQKTSANYGKLYHGHAGVAQWANYTPIRIVGAALPSVLSRKQAWIYHHDVTRN